MIAYAHPQVINQWRRQIGQRQQTDERRPLGALGYLTNGPVLGGLIEIEKLVPVVLHDEPHRGGVAPRGTTASRPVPVCIGRLATADRSGGGTTGCTR